MRDCESMATKIKRHADEDQVAGLESWICDVERNHKCRVRTVIHAAGAKGRLAIRIEACDIVGERLVGVRVQRKTSYPNSYGTSLVGVLLKELMALDSDLDAYARVCASGSSDPAVKPNDTP